MIFWENVEATPGQSWDTSQIIGNNEFRAGTQDNGGSGRGHSLGSRILESESQVTTNISWETKMAQFFLHHWIGHHQVFIDTLVKESQDSYNTKWILLSLNPIFIQIYIQHLQQANSKGANDIAIHWM